jgi:hypothetical protein
MTSEEKREANEVINNAERQGYNDPRFESEMNIVHDMAKNNINGLYNEVQKGRYASAIYLQEKITLLVRNMSVLMGCDQKDLLPKK